MELFAPYCPVCQHRVLLGPRRIVRFVSDEREREHEVVLRCFCGAMLDGNAEAPESENVRRSHRGDGAPGRQGAHAPQRMADVRGAREAPGEASIQLTYETAGVPTYGDLAIEADDLQRVAGGD